MHSTVKKKRKKGILLKEEEESSQIRGEIFFAPKISNNKSRHVEMDGWWVDLPREFGERQLSVGRKHRNAETHQPYTTKLEM